MMRNILFAIALSLPFVAYAQTNGAITGEVKDQSGAVAPNAAVTVTNAETNVMRSTTTNAAGVYSFPDLNPGMYSVKVAAAGFATVIKTNIELQVQQTARVDFSLSVGQAAQTIEVSASGSLLSTENATVGTVIEEKRISELPLNGRSFFSLVALAPNVAFGFLPAQQASGRLGGTLPITSNWVTRRQVGEVRTSCRRQLSARSLRPGRACVRFNSRSSIISDSEER